jgi:hypothetical protein
VYAFGGLDAAGKSTGTISVLRGSTVRSAGRLPVPIHDAAAASLPSLSKVYRRSEPLNHGQTSS